MPSSRVSVASAVLAAVAVSRRSKRLSAVAPDLRTPLVWFPTSVSGPRSLAVARKMLPFAPAAPLVSGVVPRTEFTGVGDSAGDRNVRVVIYESEHRARPSGALLWIHGGGLVMGTPEQGEGLCSRLATELGIMVVSVDYRLAPEHPFPAGLDDCYAALGWVHRNADILGIDPTRLAVGGDSAGGGLAASLAQVVLDRGGPKLCFQLLQYPMLDDRTALRSGLDGLVWTMRSNRWAWRSYLGHALTAPEHRPFASPSRRTDLDGLPPAWIGVGSVDLFYDECVDYAARLEAAGVPCDLHIEPGMYHGAETLRPKAPAMIAFLDRLVAALAAGLEQSPASPSAQAGRD